jgi:hypothetical protein
LAGLGEIYLEAFRVFRDESWRDRAAWIASYFTHTGRKSRSGAIYWIVERINTPTADLMTGNAGIIHFLIRFHSNNKIPFLLS